MIFLQLLIERSKFVKDENNQRTGNCFKAS
jgi:hypothetical protein